MLRVNVYPFDKKSQAKKLIAFIRDTLETKQKPPEPTAVHIEPVNINDYDMLLETPGCVCV